MSHPSDWSVLYTQSDIPPVTRPLVKRKPPSRCQLVARTGLILASEFCERMAFYSISANLFLFLTNEMKVHNETANVILFLFVGTCFVSPLLGGYFADTFLGRFQTIVLFDVVYIIGMVLLVGGTVMGKDAAPYLVYGALLVIAMGTGGIKANVMPFGADQFTDIATDSQKEQKQTFFNWSYFMINLGALVSFTGIAYLQQEKGFTYGLAVPAGVLLVSAVVFTIGVRQYVKLKPSGSIVGPSLKMLYFAFRAPWDDRNNALSFLDRAKFARKPSGVLRFTTQAVDNFKGFMRVMPVLLTLIFFWCMYAQMAGMFLMQGTGLDLRIVGELALPVTSNHIFNILAIVLLIPIFDRLVYPTLRKCNISFPMLSRMAAGMIFACLGLLYAGGLEVYRLHLLTLPNSTFVQKIGSQEYVAVKGISIFAQAPAYFLIGTGEVMTSITGIEFAYSQSPGNMKSIVMAAFYTMQALGYYLGSALTACVNAITCPSGCWINTSVNKSRLDYYFFLIAGLGLINFFIYVFVSHHYTMVTYGGFGGEEIQRQDDEYDDYDDDEKGNASFSSDTGLVGLD